MKKYLATSIVAALAVALISAFGGYELANRRTVGPSEDNIEVQGRCVNGVLQIAIGAIGPGVTGIEIPPDACGTGV